MNNSQTENVCDLKFTINLLLSMFLPAISAFGITLNFFSVFIINKMIKTIKIDGHMFKYLLVKSLDDMIIFIIQILDKFCQGDLEHSTIFGVIYYKYLNNYLMLPFLLSSSLIDALITLDIYCLITKKFKNVLHSKKFFVFVVVFIHIYCILFYISYSFQYDIIKNKKSNDSISNSFENYRLVKSDFFYSNKIKIIRIISIIQRDFLIMFLLIVFNLMIIFEMRKNLKRKKQLTNYRQTRLRLSPQTMVKKAQRSFKNQLIMVLLLNFNHFFGHIFPVCYNILFYMNDQLFFLPCFHDFTFLFLLLSYTTNIVLFYVFNKHFRNISNQFILKCFFFLKHLKFFH
jgi:hypothetical protein